MDNIAKITIGILVFIVIVGALSLMTEAPETPVVVVEEPVARSIDNELLEVFKTEYISACAEESAMLDYCKCSYDVLLEELGAEGLLTNAMEFSMGVLTPQMQDAMIVTMTKCIDYIK